MARPPKPSTRPWRADDGKHDPAAKHIVIRCRLLSTRKAGALQQSVRSKPCLSRCVVRVSPSRRGEAPRPKCLMSAIVEAAAVEVIQRLRAFLRPEKRSGKNGPPRDVGFVDARLVRTGQALPPPRRPSSRGRSGNPYDRPLRQAASPRRINSIRSMSITKWNTVPPLWQPKQ